MRGPMALLALALAACSDVPPDTPDTATLIVGVTSDFAGGSELTKLEIDMGVDGARVRDETLTVDEGSLPKELAFEDVTPGARLTLTLRGYELDIARIVRHVETRAPEAGDRALYRLRLEKSCKLEVPIPGGSGGAPECNEITETCISGACRSAIVPETAFQPYRSDWQKGGESDACKPADGGAPMLLVGQGQTDYFGMDDGEVAEIEAGPQGNHHIWVAARIKNLRQSGSITTVGGQVPELGLELQPMKWVFTLDPDEGGWCKIFGVRFELDRKTDIERLLGQQAKVQVTIKDGDGAVGTGERLVTLSSSIVK
jgi:hypothetical protein